MRRLFVDANILIRVIIGKEYRLLEYLVGAEPYTSTHVLEEAAYKLIALSIIEKEGSMSAYRIKKVFEKGIAENVIKARLAGLNKIAEKLNVIPPTLRDFEESKKIVMEYKLLPNDALIVAVMSREGIRELLTLDSDFRRIPWIQVIP